MLRESHPVLQCRAMQPHEVLTLLQLKRRDVVQELPILLPALPLACIANQPLTGVQALVGGLLHTQATVQISIAIYVLSKPSSQLMLDLRAASAALLEHTLHMQMLECIATLSAHTPSPALLTYERACGVIQRPRYVATRDNNRHTACLHTVLAPAYVAVLAV